ncbi:hypothetical protein QR680_017014 [Steinernema hermaphroditum]|uniref:AB hydrolase-1 domain-containing protein n=1 Tax=Steinernema hermaphroditum TaxID=289476 RepID=A0AA39HDH7_9BILA|nr:hypothetical protein QR680_017014 [Steinernema hermaphroditum]
MATSTSSNDARQQLRPLGSNEFLRSERISFEADGNRYDVDVLLQDTLPEGSAKGTVIATGGTPGSHRDFRYIGSHLRQMGIRYVGVNFSGYGDTPWNPKLQQTWTERLAYVQAVVDKLHLKENLVFMGHSMGTEPALKAAVQNEDKTVGVALVNPCGFHRHRSFHPFIKLQAMYWFWRLRWIFGGVIDRIVAKMYYYLFKLRLREPHNVGVCLQSCVQAEFPKQRPFVEKFNNTKLKALLAYAGKDTFIGMDTSTEFVNAFKDRADLVADDGDSTLELLEKTTKTWCSGTRVVGLHFPNDDHFVQKHRGEFIANAIAEMLKKETPSNKL